MTETKILEETVAAETGPRKARLTLDGKDYDLPVVTGSEGETGIDIQTLRSKSGAITLDPGYGNTGACESAITFIDGELGILRYRGYPIEEIAGRTTFLDAAYLLINGESPSKQELDGFRYRIARHSLLHEDMRKLLEAFPASAHPMAILSAMVSSLSAHYSDASQDIETNIFRLLAKLPTIAACSYKKNVGQPFIFPRNDLSYCGNFLHMMFAVPSEEYKVSPVLERALDLLLILHADHEQNCSTSTV
ncbi:MAG TPA: citrate/2-methylcitrate synthase, partial [Thermoanaerobaculia bacterium]|nr:citrate/2-methylcitrate synthase [Thermoanaerobaculia bacterium]